MPATVTAASTLAAYPQSGQRAKWSSPTAEGTMNSWLTSPPMAPDCASTGVTSRPKRREDPQVGVEDGLVGAPASPLCPASKEYASAHDQLAGAQQAETRPRLVAELGLDLVHGERQLAVGVDLGADGRRDHLLVGGPEHEASRPGPSTVMAGRASLPNRAARPLCSHSSIGLQGRQQHLLAARRRRAPRG